MTPVLFLGHGAPPLLDDVLWCQQLRAWAGELARPKAILIVSAHWETAPMAISDPGAGTPLVYDFAGFDARYYRMTYPSPDASWLADRLESVLPAGDRPVRTRRGLDHGAWVPLRVMYPQADIPVVQLSLPTLEPQRLLVLGGRLRDLRDEGVLIIGSGFMTHGLPYLSRGNWAGESTPPGWSEQFDLWAADALDRGDVEALADFARAPGMPYAHPTVEHLAPLFVALGAAVQPQPQTVIDGFFMGLSKRSVQLT